MSDSWVLPPWSVKYPLEFITEDMLDTAAHQTFSQQGITEQNFLDDMDSAKSTVLGEIVNNDFNPEINSEVIENLTTNIEPWDITENDFAFQNKGNRKVEKVFRTYKKSTAKPFPPKKEKITQKREVEFKQKEKFKFKPRKETSRFECTANYDAMDISQSFGLIYNNSTLAGCMSFTLHSPKKTLNFKLGDVLEIVKRSGERGVVGIKFVGRTKYVQPGRPVRSMIVGLSEEEWKRLTN